MSRTTMSAIVAEQTDEELAALAAREGSDGPAFVALVERFRARVWRICFRLLGNEQDANDAAQEVFLRIHRGLPYFRGEARLSTWIYRIVANVCVQEQQSRKPVTQSIDEEGLDRRTPSSSANRELSDLMLRDRLEKAIARLPANYRLLVAAHYLQGVRYEDLAEALNLPLGTLKTQLHRAKRQLRRLLETELK